MARIISEKASLVIKDKGLIYNICTLTQFIDGEDISFKFVPNYSVIDLLPDGLFEGIQGLNLDLRKEEYYREGVPTFIYERVPQRNRIDLERYVKASGLDYYNPIAILKEGYKYAGDNIFATKYIDPKEVDIVYKPTYNGFKEVLTNIAINNKITIDGRNIDPVTMFKALFPIYEEQYLRKVSNQRKGVEVRKSNKSYRGRKAYEVNEAELKQLFDLYNKSQITIPEILRTTGWSKSTLYRKFKLLSQN